jgi:hypothetical protein
LERVHVRLHAIDIAATSGKHLLVAALGEVVEISEKVTGS